MLIGVFTKSLRDRWIGTSIGVGVACVFLLGAMAAYQTIDISVYTDLPEAMRSVMGIADDADAATLSFSIVLGLVAAMTLAGLALSMGASSVAGEESDGTIGLLLANPRSRRALLVAKSAAMTTLVVAGAAVTLGASYLAPVILDVDIGDADLVAVVTHLMMNALVWGAMAVAIGAVTGNRSAAAAVTGGVMVACYFLVGLLPLAASTADVAKVLPWYWFDGHDPLNNGIAVGYLVLQVALIVVFLAVAWRGVEARDLTKPMGSRDVTAALVDRVRNNDLAAGVIDRLSGGARVGSIWIKTTADGQALVLIVAGVMFTVMGLMMGPMYAALESTLAEVSADLPENLLAMVGGGDMSTPEGWYRLESLGLMAPIAVIFVAAMVGARALAGEEQNRTMGLLLANPVTRRRVVFEKLGAMVMHTCVVGFATFAGIAGGSILAGLGMSIANIAAASALVTLLGIMFGTVALAVSAATGDVRIATMTTIGAAGAAYALNSVFSIADELAAWRRLSPFDWYLGHEPLVNGIDWTSVALLVGFSVIFALVAAALFDSRDLRRS